MINESILFLPLFLSLIYLYFSRKITKTIYVLGPIIAITAMNMLMFSTSQQSESASIIALVSGLLIFILLTGVFGKKYTLNSYLTLFVSIALFPWDLGVKFFVLYFVLFMAAFLSISFIKTTKIKHETGESLIKLGRNLQTKTNLEYFDGKRILYSNIALVALIMTVCLQFLTKL